MKVTKNTGFTLIELIVTVAIVSILAGVAFPAYQGQVRSARRADAQGELMQMANFMERFYTENSRYDQDMGGAKVTLPSPSNANLSYTIALNTIGQTAYTLRATPTGPQETDGYLELLETGAKRWDKNNNQSIDEGENNWER